MKKRTNCSVVAGVSVSFSTLPAPLKRRCTGFSRYRTDLQARSSRAVHFPLANADPLR
jgi:hypothetical protein